MVPNEKKREGRLASPYQLVMTPTYPDVKLVIIT
nr:MAG TPA: hypothetical protein [Bacteriophage sp.]